MASRTAPEYIRSGLRTYDRNLDVVWDDMVEGWRFTHKGQPCDFILMHRDDTLIVDLNLDETLRIARLSDMHEHYGGVLKRWRNLPGERAYRRRVVEEKRREAIRENVEKSTNNWKSGLDHAVGI